jgi:hypothetical protein
MKRILSSSLLVAALAVAFTGCLKDKGFDNHTYGINDPDTQPPGVGFVFGSNAKNDWGLDITPGTQNVTGLLYVNLEAGVPASSDVKVTLVDNTTALLNAYNTANGLTGNNAILPMPTAKYSFPATVTILAGGRNVTQPIVVSNVVLGAPPTGLDANRQYAVGIKISAVDGGYKIASNLENLFIVFGVKNKYDGRYTMRGQFYHPSLQPDFGPHVFQVEMHTAGPNTVRLYWPLVGGYNTPLTSGGGPACCFANQELDVTVNPATNAALFFNALPGPAYSALTSYGSNTYNNRWDDAAKRFYGAWGYNLGPGGTFVPGTSRAWIDTLIRTGPR